jgi:hypothetical protein
MLMTDPPCFAKRSRRGLCGKHQPAYIEVEHAVEVLLGDRLQRQEFVNSGVVHQDVDLPEFSHRRIYQRLGLRRLADVRAHGLGGAARCFDLPGDGFRLRPARRIVHYYRSALTRQLFRDGRANSLRRAGDHSYFPI